MKTIFICVSKMDLEHHEGKQLMIQWFEWTKPFSVNIHVLTLIQYSVKGYSMLTDLFAVLTVIWLKYPLDGSLWWIWDTFQEGWVCLHAINGLQFSILWTYREQWTHLASYKMCCIFRVFFSQKDIEHASYINWCRVSISILYTRGSSALVLRTGQYQIQHEDEKL